MRVLALADNQRDPSSRVEEHDRVMDFIADEADRLDVDLVLHAGDWTERRSTHEDRDFLFRWLQRVASRCPVATCEGNHEEPEFCRELALVHTNCPVEVATTPRMVFPWSARGALNGKPEAAVAMLPWARRGALLSWATANGVDMTRENLNEQAREFMRDILRGFAASWPEGVPRILMAHMIPTGYTPGPDQPPMVGCDFELAVEDLALADADVVILGHGHRPTEWSYRAADGREVPVIMCGSPRRTAFAKGEQEPKGYVLLEFDGRKLVSWERVPTPATPLHLIEARWESVQAIDGEWLQWFMDGLPQVPMNGEIRLRYEVDADQREAAARAAEGIRETLLSEGASHVKLDEQVRPTVRARAPEVAEAVGVADQLRAFWDATDPDLGEERRGRLLSLVSDLQEVGR